MLQRGPFHRGWQQRFWGACFQVEESSKHKAEPTPPPLPPLRRSNSRAYQPDLYRVPPPIFVPGHIQRPSYANDARGRPRALRDEEFAEIKGPKALQRMRRACGLAAEALVFACEIAKEGVTTDEVDRRTSEFVVARNAYPVGINYHGFPRGLCASPNEVALHGVPNTRPLEAGDIVNFDVTVFLDDAVGDCSATVRVGKVEEDVEKLVETTHACLLGAIGTVGPGQRLNEVGKFCTEFASARGFHVVSEFCGHFIGSELHMKPNVLHVPNRLDLELRPGMTFTIEPILLEGKSAEIEGPKEDGWTILSTSGDWSAQWEHTVLITEHGAEILTQPL